MASLPDAAPAGATVESRSEKRERQRTLRVVGGALRLAKGNREVAAARLRRNRGAARRRR